MSAAHQPVNEERLRGCAEYALRFDVAHDGSLYLRLLACVCLACPEADALTVLETLYYEQADAEHVDGDDVLTALLLAVPE